MELNIEDQKENTLLNRTELRGKITFSGATPSNKDVLAAIAKKQGCNEDVIAIKGIYNKFGSQEARFTAHVYKDKETLLKTEPKQKVKEEPTQE